MAHRKNTQTAAQAYAERAAEINTHIKTLVVALAAHRAQHEANPKNWGLPGDLGHVRELLVQINEFLGAEPEDADLHCDHADGCCRETVGMPCDGR